MYNMLSTLCYLGPRIDLMIFENLICSGEVCADRYFQVSYCVYVTVSYSSGFILSFARSMFGQKHLLNFRQNTFLYITLSNETLHYVLTI